MNYDLHTHTTESDGTYHPEELIAKADDAGIETLAITDHDTTSGLAAAYNASRQKNIKLIPGVELSVTWNEKNFHIIGLNIDPDSKNRIDGLSSQKKLREQRAIKIGERLENCGIHGAYAGAKQLASDESITRSHFAYFLVDSGYVKNINDVFKKYLTRNKPGYVKTRWISMEEGIHQINQSGGVAILAHPLRYPLSGTWMRKLLTAFKAAGGVGIEVITGMCTLDGIKTSGAYARRYELAGSIGSDFHGYGKNGIKLGNLRKLPVDIKPIWHIW